MSDQFMIGVVNPDNTITTVYIPWNGDLRDAGTILLEDYQSPEKLRLLAQTGFLELLEKSPADSGPADPVEFAVTVSNRQAFQRFGESQEASCLYLFVDGEWLFATPYDDGWRKLAEVLANWQ